MTGHPTTPRFRLSVRSSVVCYSVYDIFLTYVLRYSQVTSSSRVRTYLDPDNFFLLHKTSGTSKSVDLILLVSDVRHSCRSCFRTLTRPYPVQLPCSGHSLHPLLPPPRPSPV